MQSHNPGPEGLHDLPPPLATPPAPSALPMTFPVAQAMVIPLTFRLSSVAHMPLPQGLCTCCGPLPAVLLPGYLCPCMLSLSFSLRFLLQCLRDDFPTPHTPPHLKLHCWDFPGGTVDETPPANVGGPGFDPWSRKIPHAAEQLRPPSSPCATAETTCCNY